MKGIRGISQLSVRIKITYPVYVCVGTGVHALPVCFSLFVVVGRCKNSGSCPDKV